MQAIKSSDIPLVYKLEGVAFVASLPYADDQLEKGDYKHVKQLVQLELEEMQKGAVPPIDLESLAENIETPSLDALGAELLGKRSTGKKSSSKVPTRDEYERAVIEVEQFKDRYNAPNQDLYI